jgi:hypothetical protein
MFELKQNGEKYHFVLKAKNGEVILSSQMYASKTSANNGIESVKKNSQTDERYEELTAKNGKLYFNLKATNGQIIGTSQMYASESGMKNGIESVKKNAPDAALKEV